MIFKNTFKYGAFMGLGFCLYTSLMWLTELDSSHLNVGQYLDMAIILLPVSVIFFAIHQENKLRGIPILKRISLAVSISLVSFVIYDPFLYFYHHVINPEWFSYVLTFKEIELNEANVNQKLIVEQLELMKNSSTAKAGMFELPSLLASVIIVPIIISLMSLIFIRKVKVKSKKIIVCT